MKDIRRTTRRFFSSEPKIQILREALRAEISTAELCLKRKWSSGLLPSNRASNSQWNSILQEQKKTKLLLSFS